MFQALIRADGTVGEMCLLYSSRPGLGFEEAAADAIKTWRYEPPRLNGEPVTIPFVVNVSFETR